MAKIKKLENFKLLNCSKMVKIDYELLTQTFYPSYKCDKISNCLKHIFLISL